MDPDATLESPPAAGAGSAGEASLTGGTADAPAADLSAGTASAHATPAAPLPDAASAAPSTDAATGAPPADATTAAPPADAATAAPPADAGTAPGPTDATSAEGGAAAPPADARRADTLPADAAGGALKSERIHLVAASGQAMTVGVRTPLGKHMVRQFGEESNVWDTEQCVLERGADGAWQIVPVPGTTNETLVNGETITAARPLHDGDVIAVGRAAKGIVKLPLTARAV